MESFATINIKYSKNLKRRVLIEIDADKFERIAASFGLFNAEFLKSLDRAENDYKASRVKKLKALKDLR